MRTSETAIAWFGRVTPTENAADARVGYNDEYLYVRVAAFDRRIWYDSSPSPADMTDWDSVSLLLDLDGNVGTAPDKDAYRFDGQLVWWESRDAFQTAYVGDGAGWTPAALPFSTDSGWRGNAPNDDEDDRGWRLTFFIPFRALNLSGPPPAGTVWGMGLMLHDRDDAAGTPITPQKWPETVEMQQPATWGQLHFGMPDYTPLPAVMGGTATIRHGLDGVMVPDAEVGGSTECGVAAAPDYFSTWGSLNYAGNGFFNIQNQQDVADWPCYARYYVTFPLDTVPRDQVIISATLTLFQWGNAGEGYVPGPQPSLIQVSTVNEAWDESSITWNNAPRARENVAATWADVFPQEPAEPRVWDVSRAVSEAYASGGPLRLALYESDTAYHSGKYFWSSDVEAWYQEMRPTLKVNWGRPLAGVETTAFPTVVTEGNPITYSLSLLGNGELMYLINTLPPGISEPESLELQGTAIAPVYDSDRRTLTWSDAPAPGQEVVIRYTVSVITGDSTTLVSSAELRSDSSELGSAETVVIANPHAVFLPVIRQRN